MIIPSQAVSLQHSDLQYVLYSQPMIHFNTRSNLFQFLNTQLCNQSHAKNSHINFTDTANLNTLRETAGT